MTYVVPVGKSGGKSGIGGRVKMGPKTGLLARLNCASKYTKEPRTGRGSGLLSSSPVPVSSRHFFFFGVGFAGVGFAGVGFGAGAGMNCDMSRPFTPRARASGVTISHGNP